MRATTNSIRPKIATIRTATIARRAVGGSQSPSSTAVLPPITDVWSGAGEGVGEDGMVDVMSVEFDLLSGMENGTTLCKKTVTLYLYI